MVYCCSDIHGCYDKYLSMINRLPLKAEDTLYILGDVIDRGPDGIRILEDIMKRDNVILLMGNHESMACDILQYLREAGEENVSENFREAEDLWLSENGGCPTFDAFRALSPLRQNEILQFIRGLLLYEEISVNGKRFFLAHTVPSKEEMAYYETLPDECFLWGTPEYGKRYFKDTVIVTGHTPTALLSPKYEGRILMVNGLVDLDCGAVFGKPLGCLCLDTMEVFYTEA